ncbi:hypothetical protein C6376_40855 [Streptomyces sp. P3]|uniref:hypothetical protein n=1 Tax=unclassified Streptomyces TaxID=2593676 RepID=UPI000D19B02D|nr:hypothetical protein [Streptomyces sp. P3]AVV46748.1 hypothetical protein C6376_40855 [Streptomyces sp. P3]
MLDETLMALAASAGTAVAAAAGTDVWESVRTRLGGILRRENEGDAELVLARADRAAAELSAAEDEDAERARSRIEGVWRDRFEDLLGRLDADERAEVADQLTNLASLARPAGGVSAGDDGLAVGGNVSVRAGDSSVAAVRIGTVNMGNPPPPGVE